MKLGAESPKDAAEKRRRIYVSMRLPEIRGELLKLRTEYKELPKLSAVADNSKKRLTVRRRVYLTERIATLVGEQQALRGRAKR